MYACSTGIQPRLSILCYHFGGKACSHFQAREGGADPVEQPGFPPHERTYEFICICSDAKSHPFHWKVQQRAHTYRYDTRFQETYSETDHRQSHMQDNLEMLALFTDQNQDRRQEYKVWEDGYDARDVYSFGFLEQKMNYIHYNPCQPHWRLVELPEEYPWSSAKFYLAEKPSVIPVDDVRELFA